jgi:hypothetical protein
MCSLTYVFLTVYPALVCLVWQVVSLFSNEAVFYGLQFYYLSMKYNLSSEANVLKKSLCFVI